MTSLPCWFSQRLNVLERLFKGQHRFLLEGSNLLGVYTPKEICISEGKEISMFDVPNAPASTLKILNIWKSAFWSINFYQEAHFFFVGVQSRFQTVWHSLPLFIYRKAVINNVNEKF